MDTDSRKDLMASSEDLTSGFYDDEPTHWFSCFSPFFSLFARLSSSSQRDETVVPSMD